MKWSRVIGYEGVWGTILCNSVASTEASVLGLALESNRGDMEDCSWCAVTYPCHPVADLIDLGLFSRVQVLEGVHANNLPQIACKGSSR